ncbi:AarF/ABC1/UbiB kinase family protein [Schinkia azotoformans]|uniref:ABC1 kinase family protein n=1 Tax=Schinkia azotoformans TaxID=1454 RepID=UPI002DB61103|nr:AarF/ABC1/UbiB kinase family protein [Schinkia azotoformans]MEC1722806.1 AarF/ABC1/UbiB kinase family protein [Schinkia azotoformans]MED4351466.1 AarF/ABC1/UbiB kinase family protein [Schinkia azotoformans]MED4413126.1 AarF/ABC1/UbiB kinase family protein [Schinkia azotoformans]
MRLTIIRRILIIRLVVSLVLDYWKVCQIDKRLEGEERAAALNRIYSNAGKRARWTAFKLESIIVKIGQFLSMRGDILPHAFTEELTDLHDALPAATFSAVKPLLEKELNGNIYTVFKTFNEEPIAAASLAQVHKATLSDETVVAVKVIKPKMERFAHIDLNTIGLAAKVINRIPALRRKMNFVDMHREFTETIHRELDCHQELSHMERFSEMFTDNPNVKIPNVYKELSTKRILVMEFIEGARLTDHEILSKWQVDRTAIGETLLDAYFKQLLVFGFIHVDPHPGNLLILRDHRLCFLDFGMIDELTTDDVKTIRRLFQSIMLCDINGILSAFEDLGFLPPETNYKELIPMISLVLDRLDGRDGQQDSPELKQFVAGMKYFIKNSPIQLQAKYMFLLRGTGILITVLNQLAPDTNWLEILLRVGPPIFGTPTKSR